MSGPRQVTPASVTTGTVVLPTGTEAGANARLVHGITFVILMAGAFAVPALRRWPWLWLAPFLVYFTLVTIVPGLRNSFVWLRAGKGSHAARAATLGIMIITTTVLLVFNSLAHPDVRNLKAALPLEALGSVIAAGVIFSVVNATQEELVFRGIVFDALRSQWGPWFTLIATSLLFGLGHLRGYPPGLLGAGLATLFGFSMGVLRLWTGGLALPIVAHIGADATIYWILRQAVAA